MKDVMLDLETLGTAHDALIIQIGAVYFDRTTGELGRNFKATIDADDVAGLFSMEYGTVMWWLEQSQRARDSVLGRSITKVSMSQALSDLAYFLGSDVTLWSHATFDMPILSNAFAKMGIKNPVPFRNMRDLRTLMDLYGEKVELEREGTHHDAHEDARYQARYASVALMKLAHGNT